MNALQRPHLVPSRPPHPPSPARGSLDAGALEPPGASLTAPGAKTAGAAFDPPPRASPAGDRLTALLVRHFRLPRFHPWQREAIDALLEEEGRVLLVAPTGGGKSLCYQLPAVALAGTALVLSPLISLMEDQVRALEARGIAATFIASSLPREENARRMGALRRGEYTIVYAAPERLAFDGFLDALGEVTLSLVAIDEAHCIVQWGHDFRPDYLRIGEAVARLRPPRIIACTATATPDARAEILRRLGFFGGREPAVILRGFARPNLHLAVREVSGPRDARAETTRALAEALGDKRARTGAGIVYSATRRGAEQIAEHLREEGWEAEAYHAGMPAETRARVSAAFAARTLPVVVATNAFGMGIDRPDVRIVIHAQPPSSIEAYYQEVGRAGRDGAQASGLLLIAGVDIALRHRMAELGPDGGAASPADAARAWGLFRELLRYVDASSCRHDFILRYFGDEAESLGGCGHCDVCRDLEEQEAEGSGAHAAAVDVVRRALAGVARGKGSAGMQAIAAMIVGERNARVVKLGLDRLSTFGVLEGWAADDAMRVLRILLANGWVDLSASEFPVPLITETGWQVMKGERPAPIRFPPGLGPGQRGRGRAGRGARPRSAARSGTGGSGGEATKKRRTVEDAVAMGMDRDLFEALREHRAGLARERDVPAYVIAPDRTLMELALLRPRMLHDLAQAHGMGPARITAFGEGLLDVLLRHDRIDGGARVSASFSLPGKTNESTS
jgi:ATP-dependent DNA helicase RecQ